MRERDNGQRTREGSLSPMEEELLAAHKKMAQEERKRALANQLAGLDNRITEIAEKAADFVMQYGENDFRAQMLLMFLDVAVEMKEMVKMFDSVNMATQFIYECTDFIDESLKFNFDLQDRSLATKYGPFQRLAIRIKNKRTIRNNNNRMRVIMSQIASQQTMARDMVDSMQYSCTKMRESMERATKRRAARDAKRAEKGEHKTVLSNKSAGAEMVAAIIARKRAETGKTADAGSFGASAGTSPASANDDFTNIDDVT